MVTDVWYISQKRTDSEYKDCSSIGFASEFQVLLYAPLVLNTVDSVMISTLISFGDLQNINLFLRPGKMNGYVKAPGQTSLLKISKIIVKPIWPDPTLIPHSLVAPALPPALSSAQRWWNDTKAMKTIQRGAIELSRIPNSSYPESYSETWADRAIQKYWFRFEI